MFQITSLRKASAFTSNNWQSAICFFFSTVWQVQITLSYHCGNVILLSTLSYILSYHRRNIKNYGCVCSSKSKTFLYFCCPLLSSQIVLMILFLRNFCWNTFSDIKRKIRIYHHKETIWIYITTERYLIKWHYDYIYLDIWLTDFQKQPPEVFCKKRCS